MVLAYDSAGTYLLWYIIFSVFQVGFNLCSTMISIIVKSSLTCESMVEALVEIGIGLTLLYQSHVILSADFTMISLSYGQK